MTERYEGDIEKLIRMGERLGAAEAQARQLAIIAYSQRTGQAVGDLVLGTAIAPYSQGLPALGGNPTTEPVKSAEPAIARFDPNTPFPVPAPPTYPPSSSIPTITFEFPPRKLVHLLKSLNSKFWISLVVAFVVVTALRLGWGQWLWSIVVNRMPDMSPPAATPAPSPPSEAPAAPSPSPESSPILPDTPVPPPAAGNEECDTLSELADCLMEPAAQ